MRRTLRVFEHETVRFPCVRQGTPFDTSDWEALVRFNEAQGGRYFAVLHRGVRFAQYVGVIQLGSLTVEILPKADRNPPDPSSAPQWRGVLLDMLRQCQLLTPTARTAALLDDRPGPLLDVFLAALVAEAQTLVHQGLQRQYRTQLANTDTLRGSLQFGPHLRHNLIHRERFFVRHRTYDGQHAVHQLLATALRLVPVLTAHPPLQRAAHQLADHFPTPPQPADAHVCATARQLLASQPRQWQGYATAVALATWLVRGQQPDLRGGEQPAVGILFNMNALFEEYVYRELKRAQPGHLRVERQLSEPFWADTHVRADLVIRRLDPPAVCVVDTKWKILTQPRPAAADLRQMYVYHQYYRASHTVLLYPHAPGLADTQGDFRPTPTAPAQTCRVRFLPLVHDGQLRRGWGKDWLASLFDI